MAKLPEELEVLVENLSPFQRLYAEYRAKGLSQGEAAKRAGSNAKEKAVLARTGYAAEQYPGVKEYILWLQKERASVAMIDQTEVIDKLRTVYREAMQLDKFDPALDAVKMLGQMIGLFVGGRIITSKKDEVQANCTDAFKEVEEDQSETMARMERLQQMVIASSKNK